jgi:erythromycin esterase
LEYLQKVDPGEADDINARLLNHNREDAVYVRDHFAQREALYISLSSVKEYNITFRITNNLIASLEIWDRLRQGRPTLGYRDSVNIQNVNCIMENLLAGPKIVLWAHNGHICTGYWLDTGGKVRILGSRLREQFGASYYPIGTEFYGGHFRAWDACYGHDYLFISQTVAAPPGDSYTYMFKQAQVPFFFLDLKHIDYSDSGTEWILGPARLRSIGASYCFSHDLIYYDTISLPEYYDALMFVETSSPTTPISFD